MSKFAVRQETSKPSTNFDNLGKMREGAGVDAGDEKVIKKCWRRWNRSAVARKRRCLKKKKNVTRVISGLLTWCVYELLKEASGKCSGGSNMPCLTQRETISGGAARASAAWAFLSWDFSVSTEDVRFRCGARRLMERGSSGFFGICCCFVPNALWIFSPIKNRTFIFPVSQNNLINIFIFIADTEISPYAPTDPVFTSLNSLKLKS